MKSFLHRFHLLLVILLGTLLGPAYAQQAPTYEWAWAGGGNSANPYVFGSKIAIDGAGNSFTLGMFQNGPMVLESTTLANRGSSDIFLTKHNPQGRLLWVQQLGGPQKDWSVDVAVNAAGDVYVTGFFLKAITIGSTTLQNPAINSQDLFLAKFSSQGNLLWARQSTSSSAVSTLGLNMSLDDAGNVYLMGTKGYGTSQLDQFRFTSIDSINFVAHYSSQGALQWVKTGFGRNSCCIVRSNDGKFYIAGHFGKPSGIGGSIRPGPARSFGVFLARFDAQFNCLWVRYGYLDASYYDNTGCTGLAVDPVTGGVVGTFFFGGPFNFDGHLFNCTGGCFPISANRDTGTDALVLKYDAQGQFLWANQAGGPLPLDYSIGVSNGLAVGQSDIPTSPSIDAAGNTYVLMRLPGMPSLTTYQTSPYQEYIHLFSYTPAGVLRWTRLLPSTPQSATSDLVCSQAGALYVTGNTYGPAVFDKLSLNVAGTYNAFTAKLVVPDSPVAGAHAIPTIITPNGDGLNETFRLPGLPTGPWQLDVYTRWGARVYRSDDYRQDWNAPGLPDGVYYYYLQSSNQPVRKGWLEVKR